MKIKGILLVTLFSFIFVAGCEETGKAPADFTPLPVQMYDQGATRFKELEERVAILERRLDVEVKDLTRTDSTVLELIKKLHGY